MSRMLEIDWSKIFVPSMSLAEIAVRGALVYLGLCVLLRIIPKRQVGLASVSDMMFVVIVGGIAVEALAKDAHSLADFFLTLVVILLLGLAVDWLAFKQRWFRRLIEESPAPLVRDGRLLRNNLRREMISEEELLTQLRLKGVDEPALVKEAELEADGEISVVTKKDSGSRSRKK